MAISDYLYEVIDALPGQYGGYANALTTLLGGDSKRQRANRNVQAAMALFGANPSEQEIQAFAANDMQPAMPEEADATAYGPRLEQLRTVAQQNVPLVEAARLAGAGGDTPSVADVATAWKLRELRRLVNDEQFTPEQRAAMATGVDVSPFKSAAYGTYNRYDGSSVVNPVGQSEIGVNQARAGDYRSSAASRASRTQAQNAEDAARAWAAEQYGQYQRAGADLRKSEQADIDWRRNYVQRFTQDPTVDPGVAVDAAQKKKLTGTPQRFKVKGPDGSTVWATGTMGVDGKPILTPSTLEVPPNADTSKSYEWQSVDAALSERFPHSTPQERIAYIKGSDMDRSRIMRGWSERAYDADTDEGDGAPAPTPVSAPQPTRAPTSAAMPPNRGGGKAAKKAQLVQYADEAVRGGADPAKVQQELQRMLQSLEGP